MCLPTYTSGLTSSLATSNEDGPQRRLSMSSITAPMRVGSALDSSGGGAEVRRAEGRGHRWSPDCSASLCRGCGPGPRGG